MNEKWDNLAEILKTSNNIVFFGGAGTSTETRLKYLQKILRLYLNKLSLQSPINNKLDKRLFR